MAVQIIIFIAVGLAGGVIGGMGMGGGTLLIPLLVMFTGTSQHVAQAVNLLAFIPMSLAALVIHIKNGLIEYKYIPLMALPAVATGILSAWLAKSVDAGRLKMYFGIFLIVLGVYQLVCLLVKLIKKKKAEKAQKAQPQSVAPLAQTLYKPADINKRQR